MATETGTWPEDEEAMREAALAFDLKRLERRFLDDPYPLYQALRRHDPIHRMPDGSYFLSRYEDCAAVYRDAASWSSDKTIDFRPNFGASALYEHHTTSLVFNDSPYHTRVRRLLAPAFTPRALKALQPRVEALIDRLLDGLEERGRFDLIADFAAAIPCSSSATCWACRRQSAAPCAAGRSPSSARSSRCCRRSNSSAGSARWRRSRPISPISSSGASRRGAAPPARSFRP
jgi:cytochrome P450